MIKKYYKIQFQLVSPLSVGCGNRQVTDSDLLLDSRGLPYIPGTSLAGVYRRIFSDKTADAYFGRNLTEEIIQKSSEEGKNGLTESRVMVYDAHILSPEKCVITKRDMVALDEYKVAVPGAKFDFQILEPGVEFVTYIEQNIEKDSEQYVLDEIAYAWQQGKIRLGAKTGKGYGQTKSVKISRCSFCLTDQTELDHWLDFDMYDNRGWSSDDIPVCLSQKEDCSGNTTLEQAYKDAAIQLRQEQTVCIRVGLQQTGGISVRQYATGVEEADYMQMHRKDQTPVIPGTSWAGAFRAQMGKLNPYFAKNSKQSELFFGKMKGEKSEESHRTRITFSESELKKGEWVVYTRNAVDRFTGGTVDGALYTEKTYYNGTTQLDMICDFSGLEKEKIKEFGQTLAGAIMDLHAGFLSVGGLTSVGHGLFQVTEVTVNKKKIDFQGENDQARYQQLWSAIAKEERTNVDKE